jgi:hypothetical protein
VPVAETNARSVFAQTKAKKNIRMGGAALWAESRKEIGQEYVIVPDFACL